MGQRRPAMVAAGAAKAEVKAAAHAKGGVVTPEARQYWAYQPIRRPPVPAVSRRGGNPIDAFILARLERAALQPATPAGRVALGRRAYYDRLGLPPTPAEVA